MGPFPPLVQPITANGNEVRMQFFIGMRSAALIPPGEGNCIHDSS